MADLRKFRLYVWFLQLLLDYLHTYPIAEVVGQELGFRFPSATGTQARVPDLGVVLNSNPVPLGEWDGEYRGIFDMCIEAVSDSTRSQIQRDTTTKFREYAQAGVTEYFILDESPPNRANETAFYRLGPNGIYQPIPAVNGVIRSSVLPFMLPLFGIHFSANAYPL